MSQHLRIIALLLILIASIVLICKSLWIKASAKLLNVRCTWQSQLLPNRDCNFIVIYHTALGSELVAFLSGVSEVWRDFPAEAAAQGPPGRSGAARRWAGDVTRTAARGSSRAADESESSTGGAHGLTHTNAGARGLRERAAAPQERERAAPGENEPSGRRVVSPASERRRQRGAESLKAAGGAIKGGARLRSPALLRSRVCVPEREKGLGGGERQSDSISESAAAELRADVQKEPRSGAIAPAAQPRAGVQRTGRWQQRKRSHVWRHRCYRDLKQVIVYSRTHLRSCSA